MNSSQRFRELLEDWFHWIKVHGFLAIGSRILGDIVRLPFRRINWMVMSIPLSVHIQYRLNPELQIRDFQTSDIWLVRAADRPSEANLCRRRLSKQQEGLAVFLNGEFVGHGWVSTGVDRDLERIRWNLLSGDILCADFFTTENYRRQGVHTALFARFAKLYKNRGYSRAIAFVDRANTPAVSSWKALGAKPVALIRYIRLGPCRFQHSQFID